MDILYKNKKDITKWLDTHGVENYIIKKEEGNYIVDVHGSVDLSHKGLNYIPVVFNCVTGDFNASHNSYLSFNQIPNKKREFNSFLGMPRHVGGKTTMIGNLFKEKAHIIEWLKFHDIHNFELIEDSLYGHIVNVDSSLRLDKKMDFIRVKFNEVKGYFYCAYTGLKSLEGSPHSVEFDVRCSYNPFTSLEFCPQIIGGDFICENSSLETLEFIPQRVERNVSLGYLHDFEGTQNINSLEQLTILSESEKLEKIIQAGAVSNKTHKI